MEAKLKKVMISCPLQSRGCSYSAGRLDVHGGGKEHRNSNKCILFGFSELSEHKSCILGKKITKKKELLLSEVP